MANTILILITAFILLEFILSRVLAALNLRTWNKPLPPEVEGLYDVKKYNEAKEYARVNFRFGLLTSTFSLAITLLFLWLKCFSWLDGIARGFSDSAIIQALIFFGILGAASAIIGLPVDVYETFVIEEKFGFNKMTPKLFISDKIKGLLLAVVLGGGLLALLTFLFGVLGNNFWLVAWAVVSAISVLVAMFYTSVFLPIFNKLTPLGTGDLRASIENYATQVNFPSPTFL